MPGAARLGQAGQAAIGRLFVLQLFINQCSTFSVIKVIFLNTTILKFKCIPDANI